MSVVLKLKKVTVVFLSIIGTVTVILCSDTLKQGVKTALSLCSGSVIPSLFLFTALALFIAKSYVSETLGKVFSILFRPILGLSAKESTAFLLSCLAGYPVGAKLLDSLYRDGKITRPKALKMLTFSVNAGPAFIVTAVGGVILKSTSDGLRLTLIHFTATLILGILVNILPDFKPKSQPTQHKKPVTKNSDEPNLIDLFVLSVAEAGQTMLNICTFIVFFGAVGYFLATSPIGYAEKLSAVIEVTSGLFNFTRTELPEISFFLGFGGISVIFQVLSTAKSIRPPIWLIVLSRFAHGIISAFLTVLAENLWPRSLSTGFYNVQPQGPIFYQTPLAGLSLIFLFVVLVAFCRKTKSSSPNHNLISINPR